MSTTPTPGAASELQALYCPFCAGLAQVEQLPESDKIRPLWWLCGCADADCLGMSHMPFERRGDAIRAWNRRAIQPAPVMEGAQREAVAPPTAASGGVTDAMVQAAYVAPLKGGRETVVSDYIVTSDEATLEEIIRTALEAADRARKPVDASAQAASAGEPVAPVGYTLQSTRDGSILQEFAWCRWSSFNDDMERLREHGWNKSGAAKIVPLYLAAPTPDSRDSDRSAAYREVTLEDMRAAFGAWRTASDPLNTTQAALDYFRSIGAVIRTDGQQAQLE